MADSPILTSFFLIDLDTQLFSNYGNGELQPVLYRGTNGSVETQDPNFVDSLIEVSSGQQLTLGPVKYRFLDRAVNINTHLLKIKLLSYPSESTFGDLITLTNDKSIKFQISSSGGLRVQSSSTTIFQTTGIQISLNTWYWVRIIFSRGTMEHHFFDCSIIIEVLGLGEEQGTTFKCNSFIHLIISY